jgi:hypothetical protein
MGDFTITIKAVGGHGCQREKGDGAVVEDCGHEGCVDCSARRFVADYAKKASVREATLQHWPEQPGPLDDLLPGGKRKGSF